jgi:hypothetical protein
VLDNFELQGATQAPICRRDTVTLTGVNLTVRARPGDMPVGFDTSWSDFEDVCAYKCVYVRVHITTGLLGVRSWDPIRVQWASTTSKDGSQDGRTTVRVYSGRSYIGHLHLNFTAMSPSKVPELKLHSGEPYGLHAHSLHLRKLRHFW